MQIYKESKHWLHEYGLRLMTAMLAWLLCFPLAAGGDKKTEKAYKKQCKKEIKNLQSEGWKVYGTSQKLEDLLLSYYLELADGALPIHVQQDAPIMNVAMSKAKLMAQKMYGESIESIIKVQTQTEMTNVDTGDDVQSEERFRAIVQQKVEQRIKGFAPRITLTRNTKDGKVEVMQFYTYKLTE